MTVKFIGAIRLLSIGVGMLMLCACIRYVPSRYELNSRDSDKAGGEQQFQDFERTLRTEKELFLKERRAAAAEAQIVPTYTLGPGDVVDVQVFGLPDMSARSRVRPSGTISLPLLDDVKVEGLTEDELQRHLIDRLAPFVRRPKVKVAIEEYRAHRVSIIGAVAKPGDYPLRRSDYTLLDLLSEAGGRTQDSGRRIVLVPAEKRRFEAAGPAGESQPADGGSGGIEFDVEEFYGDVGKRPVVLPLLPGDTVVVPEAGSFNVVGDVKNPGAFPLASRTTVLGAIATAGGLEYSADVGQVELIRNVGEGRQATISFDLEKLAVKDGNDLPLRNGDVVRVPSQETRFFQRQIVEFLNGILHVGYSGT